MANKVDELKAKVLKAQTDADIAALYMLEKDAHDTFDEDTLSGFYANTGKSQIGAVFTVNQVPMEI